MLRVFILKWLEGNRLQSSQKLSFLIRRKDESNIITIENSFLNQVFYRMFETKAHSEFDPYPEFQHESSTPCTGAQKSQTTGAAFKCHETPCI